MVCFAVSRMKRSPFGQRTENRGKMGRGGARYGYFKHFHYPFGPRIASVGGILGILFSRRSRGLLRLSLSLSPPHRSVRQLFNGRPAPTGTHLGLFLALSLSPSSSLFLSPAPGEFLIFAFLFPSLLEEIPRGRRGGEGDPESAEGDLLPVISFFLICSVRPAGRGESIIRHYESRIVSPCNSPLSLWPRDFRVLISV